MEHLIESEFEDFELASATYRVLINLLTAEDDDLQYHALRDYTEPEEACRYADKKADELYDLLRADPMWEDQEVLYMALTVETIIAVDSEEDYVGQIYNKVVYTRSVEN